MEILIDIEHPVMRVNQQKLIENISAVMRILGLPGTSQVSILLVDNLSIRRYNKRLRNVDKVTDCLSFPQMELSADSFEDALGEIHQRDPKIPIPLGDIIVSLDRAKEQAKELGHSIDKEMLILIVHGIFHLIGIHHDQPGMEESVLGRLESLVENLNIEQGVIVG